MPHTQTKSTPLLAHLCMPLLQATMKALPGLRTSLMLARRKDIVWSVEQSIASSRVLGCAVEAGAIWDRGCDSKHLLW